MSAALVVHAHFYQPPRAHPVSGAIPPETGADPFANWNERIHAECYHPNAELGNFEAISFDLGPTLAEWLEEAAPATYQRIRAAEQARVAASGFGGALAQPFHHTILPLASRREKQLQVAWGVADFEHRFGRKPRGLWLPETAVDVETLEVMADFGLAFTVLAPWQAVGAPDPFRPHWVELPSGRPMAAFFYHGPLSGRLSFDPGVSENADAFVRDWLLPLRRQAGSSGSEAGRLILVATDGELYGHHQRFRDLFLRHLVRQAAPAAGMPVTSLEAHLEQHPPTSVVRLRAPSSWSCHHGVARWAGDCPCSRETGWKGALRESFLELGRVLDECYLEHAEELGLDGEGLLERSVDWQLGKLTYVELLEREGRPPADREASLRLLWSLESQWLRHRMFTSCAWFHGEFDRLEVRNNLSAALVAQELAERARGRSLAPGFRRRVTELAQGRIVGDEGRALLASLRTGFLPPRNV
jgi:hypothetical protein